ncbi:MAG: hypothetical protein IPK52_25985 [Chloroflexi bacterium]|nr:hypothetical protein [Chloroflexota bacterium]
MVRNKSVRFLAAWMTVGSEEIVGPWRRGTCWQGDPCEEELRYVSLGYHPNSLALLMYCGEGTSGMRGAVKGSRGRPEGGRLWNDCTVTAEIDAALSDRIGVTFG